MLPKHFMSFASCKKMRLDRQLWSFKRIKGIIYESIWTTTQKTPLEEFKKESTNSRRGKLAFSLIQNTLGQFGVSFLSSSNATNKQKSHEFETLISFLIYRKEQFKNVLKRRLNWPRTIFLFHCTYSYQWGALDKRQTWTQEIWV